jgi:hypothetical protein
MADKTDTAPSVIKMEQARRLMDQGHYQESLILALEALLQELDFLREALLALPTVTDSTLPAAPSPALEEPPHPELYWLPPIKPRVLH